MSELSTNVLHLIEEGYSINEICSSLGISHKQLSNVFRGLRQLGIEFNKKFYYNGETLYVPKKDISYETKKNNVNIITNPNCDTFKTMVISDLHAGNELESIYSWNKIYDYCIVHNIHTIIIAGDFLDGINIGIQDYKKHTHSLEQIKYAINNYPFDKNILNFLILGNHDVDSLSSFGIDFATYLRNFRLDIIPVGYGYGRINVKNDRIFVTHPLCMGIENNMDLTGNYLLLKGHHHVNKSIISGNGNCSISVPTLSNLFLSDEEFLPGAIVINTKFKNGFFDTVYVDNLLIGDRVNVVSTMQYSITPSKDRKFDGSIKHEEDFCKRKILKQSKNKNL